MMMTRRSFLRYLAGLTLTPLVAADLGKGPVWAGDGAPSIGETYAGEDLEYDIAFWLFKKVARAKLSFQRDTQKGRYVATLQGETLGLLGFVARYRTDAYKAVMEEVEGGRRLRSLSFEEHVTVGKKTRKNLHTFDHNRRIWTHQTIRASGASSTEEKPIPPGKYYDDFLTAAYNFRHGIYGPMERGKTYSVATFPRKDVMSYEVRVLPQDEERRRRRKEKVGEAAEYLIELSMDPDVVNSKEGEIEGWLSREVYPVQGTIKDVFLFGDVLGTLTKRTLRQQSRPEST